MAVSYKVVPFVCKIKGGQSADIISQELQTIIDRYVKDGWEFYQLGEVNIEVAPGCLAGLFGARAVYVKYDQVIFRKES